MSFHAKAAAFADILQQRAASAQSIITDLHDAFQYSKATSENTPAGLFSAGIFVQQCSDQMSDRLDINSEAASIQLKKINQGVHKR